jgi:multiple sugar transport system permease protein
MATSTAALGTTRRSPWARKQRYAAYLFVLPSLVFLVLFVVYPIVAALYFSFTKYTLLEAPRWVGLDQYRDLMTDPRFVTAIGNTFVFALMTVPVGTALALLMALVIDRPLRGMTFFRTTYYLPVVSSFVAVSYIWFWIYEPQFGVLNDLFEVFGLPRLYWLRDPSTAMLSIAILSIWKNVGYNMVIYLAGLQGIPTHLYEAAKVDGANSWQRFWKITVPLLSPTTFFVFVVYFIGALQMFVQSWILTQGGPLDSTLTVVYLIYQNGFEYLKMGYAAAMSMVLFVIIALITYVNTRIVRYDSYY